MKFKGSFVFDSKILGENENASSRTRVSKINPRFRCMGIDIAMVVKPSNIHAEDKERYVRSVCSGNVEIDREGFLCILTRPLAISLHPGSPL